MGWVVAGWVETLLFFFFLGGGDFREMTWRGAIFLLNGMTS